MYLSESNKLNERMLDLVKNILKSYTIDVNIQDADGNTALHCAVKAQNLIVFKEILFNTNSKPNLSIKNKNEQTVLWLALMNSEEKS
jgi:ankyrin repeat protein